MITSSTSIIKKTIILFLVIIGLYYGRDFLIPLSIGGVIATFFLPFCKWLESKKIARGFATSICILLILLFIITISIIIGWQVSEITNDISLIKKRVIETVTNIQTFLLNHFGLSFGKQYQIISAQQSSVSGIITIMTNSVFNLITNFFLILVYVFGLLYYRGHIKQFLLKLAPPSQKHDTEKIIYKVAYVSQQYLLGLSKMIVCLWIMYGIGFSIIGVENALFFAILCGLLEIVPFIGNITGTTITVLVAATQGASVTMILSIVGTYGVIQIIQGWLLEPIIVGSQVKINPLFTIISLVIGELIWGIPGIFLAIPLIAMFKIVCDYIEPLKPYGFLIGEVEKRNK